MSFSLDSDVRLAIVGCGGIAQTHAAAIRLVPGTRLTAVCSSNGEKAQELAAVSGARVFSSIDALLSSDEIDAVLVATPSGVHQDAAIPALRSGRHVLCEKPLEISTERIRNLVDEAEKSGRILACFFPLRWGRGAQTISRAVTAGRFGRLTFLSARVKWWQEQDYYGSSSWRGTWNLDGGGALMNQGIHAVDLLQWIGGTVIEVSAYSGMLAKKGIEVEDTLAGCLRFAHGGLGTIEASTSCYPGLDLSLEVSGDAGTAILVNDRIELWNFRETEPEDAAIRAGEFAELVRGGTSDPRAISCEGHRHQIEDFCRAIRGADIDLINGRDAGRAVAIIEMMYRSVRSGRSEVVSYL